MSKHSSLAKSTMLELKKNTIVFKTNYKSFVVTIEFTSYFIKILNIMYMTCILIRYTTLNLIKTNYS